jgi:uncharacterized membrane protein (UPF0127 family)
MKLRIKDYIFLVIMMIGLIFVVFQKISNKNIDNKKFEKGNQIQLEKIIINNTPLNVVVVSSEELRRKGLGGVEELDSNEGMLFVHEEPFRYSYSMRDMKIDLDFIFINQNKIVDIAKSVSYRYNGAIEGGVEYDKVLEVNADWTKKNNIKIGDLVEFSE